MVEMLSRYKESSVQRFDYDNLDLSENFNSSKLLEEYRLFPKYPESQLKIASTLFDVSVWRHSSETVWGSFG
uniref:Uncharacterized protein n=1 Tax=Noccaea caerulescens TaxID=107243 RepID=A0A1J3KAE2_NOCCA